MIQQGGKRPGAGRPKGSGNIKSMMDRARFITHMQDYLELAVATLADIAENGKSEAARVSAATEIINRAVGRTVVAETAGQLEFGLLKAMLEHDREEFVEAGAEFLLEVPLTGLFDR